MIADVPNQPRAGKVQQQFLATAAPGKGNVGQCKLAEAKVRWHEAQDKIEASVVKDEADALRKAPLGITGQISWPALLLARQLP